VGSGGYNKRGIKLDESLCLGQDVLRREGSSREECEGGGWERMKVRGKSNEPFDPICHAIA
jgi:hypothetical protein